MFPLPTSGREDSDRSLSSAANIRSARRHASRQSLGATARQKVTSAEGLCVRFAVCLIFWCMHIKQTDSITVTRISWASMAKVRLLASVRHHYAHFTDADTGVVAFAVQITVVVMIVTFWTYNL